jgi:predicted secreted Zn-dependent protease
MRAKHEAVHVAIAEKYARKIGEELKALPAKKNCDALDASAERVLKRNKRRAQPRAARLRRRRAKTPRANFSTDAPARFDAV